MNKALIAGMLVLLSFVTACSKSGSITAPSGNIVTVDIDTIEHTGLLGDTVYNFTVTVTDEDGNPLNDAKVYISSPLAEPRVPAYFQFYTGVNKSGSAVNSGFYGRTDDHGLYKFSIEVYGGSIFESYINISSGTGSAQIDLAFD